MKKWFFNPFIYVAGSRSLIIGWCVILLTVVVSFFSRTHFNGALDTHNSHDAAPIWIHFSEALIDWGCLAGIFYFCGLVFSKSAIRFIDVAGTMAMARWPMLPVAIIGFGIRVPATLITLNDILKSLTPQVIFCSILDIVFTVWMVALCYNAFSVSCNLKGGKAAWVFTGGIIVAEIVSKIIFHEIIKNLL